ncbi:response regulator [Sediminicurvatus halobius]|uniref:Response regulator n=1 Tax=Sediminicurvatus halobius TaxID=2182432 RepID=A0A2U2N4G8_9GAMM|nr:response regulator [Spiribacter halobius]PWG64135.1 response regulator [Spiribacter halobius]UEX78743.1 response regulator [Spiribacter halobius]
MAAILAVDDSASIRQMVRYTLTQAGHQVADAADGNQGLAAAQRQGFNAVITDVNMPGIDGIELVRRLRALPNYRFTPILLLTTESAPEKKQQGKAAGATGWLVKPFEPQKLLATLDRVLR